jgi:hypothetical protein
MAAHLRAVKDAQIAKEIDKELAVQNEKEQPPIKNFLLLPIQTFVD